MATLCCMVGCNSLGTKSCGACGEASYCSATCQKGDWKVHKHSCVNINKLPMTFLSLPQMNKYYDKINDLSGILQSQGKVREAITLLQKYLAFVEHQFGVQVEGKSYYKRSNGSLVNNRGIINIRMDLARKCSSVGDFDATMEHAMAARPLLEHQDKSDDSNLLSLTEIEKTFTTVYSLKHQYDVAEYHCEQCLMFARLIKGEGRIFSENQALQLFASIRLSQCRSREAIELFEQAYILVSVAYGPVHPDVQFAATHLIRSLIENKDYSRADNYCHMNYENLTDPRNGIDQSGRLVADTMMQLADIWLKMPPVDDEEAAFALAEKAENMIRKACLISDARCPHIFHRYMLYADILIRREKYTDETRMVLEQSLAASKEHSTGTTFHIIGSLENLAHFHDHMSATMPPGNARVRELRLRDKYADEAEVLAKLLPASERSFHKVLIGRTGG